MDGKQLEPELECWSKGAKTRSIGLRKEFARDDLRFDKKNSTLTRGSTMFDCTAQAATKSGLEPLQEHQPNETFTEVKLIRYRAKPQNKRFDCNRFRLACVDPSDRAKSSQNIKE